MVIAHAQIHRSRSDMCVSIHGKTLKVPLQWHTEIPKQPISLSSSSSSSSNGLPQN